MKLVKKIFILVLLFVSSLKISAMDFTDTSFWIPTLQKSDFMTGQKTNSDNTQNSFSGGISTALTVFGTAGALRVITSLTALNTVMHGYVIAKLNALGGKINGVSIRLCELKNIVKINHSENMAAHMQSKQTIDNVRQLNEQLQKNFKEHHEITSMRFDNTEQNLKKIENLLARNDKKNATRLRRTARIVTHNQKENFNRLMLENENLKNMIGEISKNQVKLSENQIGLTEALEKFSPTHAKWAQNALWLLRRMKH